MAAVLEPRMHEKVYVRLRFMGEGLGPGSPKPPLKGTLRDVEIGDMTELNNAVEQWLGSPGEWKLNSASNWPLQDEALQRPTTFNCPLLVNVVNGPLKTQRAVDCVSQQLRDLEERLSKELKTKLDARQLADRIDKLACYEEYWYELMRGSAADGNVGTHPTRSSQNFRCDCCSCRNCWALLRIPTQLILFWLLLLSAGVYNAYSDMYMDWRSHDDSIQEISKELHELKRQTVERIRDFNNDQVRQDNKEDSSLRADQERLNLINNTLRENITNLAANTSNLSAWLGQTQANITNLAANTSNLSAWLAQTQAMFHGLQHDQDKLSGKIKEVNDQFSVQITKVEEDQGELSSKLRGTVQRIRHNLKDVQNQTSSLEKAEQADIARLQHEMEVHEEEAGTQMVILNRTLDEQITEVHQLNRTLPELRGEVAKQASSISSLWESASELQESARKSEQKGMDAEQKVNMIEKEVKASLQHLPRIDALQSALKQQQVTESQFTKRLDSLEAKVLALMNGNKTAAGSHGTSLAWAETRAVD